MARKRRLNTNLIIALTCGVAVTLLGLYFGAKYYLDNVDRAIRRATQAEESGDWGKAGQQWGKAYRQSGDVEHGLRGVRAIAYLTSDEENGAQTLAQMGGMLQTILTGAPSNEQVLREIIRFYAEDPAFLVGRPTVATGKVRESSQKLLDVAPGDAEARTYLAATTLDYDEIAAQGITEAESDQARADLRELAVTAPLDGIAITALRADLAGRIAEFAADDDAQGQLDELATVLDGFTAAIGEAEPRESRPYDAAYARARGGQGYELAAALAEQIALRGLNAADADRAAVIADARAAAEPYLEKALAQYRLAAELTAGEEHLLAPAYAETRALLADAVQRRGGDDNRREAEAILRETAEARPWDAGSAMRLATFYRDVGRYADATAALERAAENADEPLPELKGYAGPAVLLERMFVDLYLADALLRERREGRREGGGAADAATQRDLLARAREATARYKSLAAQRSLGDSPVLSRVEGQLAIAGGDTFAGIDQLEAALRQFEQMRGVAADREEVDLLRLLADVNREAGQSGSEIEYLARAFRRGNRIVDGIRLANLYVASGDAARAKDIVAALEAMGDRLPPQFQGEVARLGVAVKGDAERGEALANLPESTDVEQAAKIQAAVGVGDFETAVRVARKLYETDPADASRGRALAALIARADTDAARAEAAGILEPLAASDPVSARLLAQLRGDSEAVAAGIDDPVQRALYEAQLAERDGDTARAIELARQALDEAKAATSGAAAGETGPFRRLAAESLFNLYVDAGRLEEAEALVEELKLVGGDGVGGRTYAVQLALARGELQRAVDEATALAELYPQSARAQLLRSQVFRRAGRNGEAADSAANALRLAPTDLRTIVEAAVAYEAAGRPDDAREVVRRGLAAQPQSPRLAQLDESLELRYGDPTPVIADRRQALQNAQDDPSAHLRLIGTLAAAADNARQAGDASAANRYTGEAADAALAAADQFPAEARMLSALTAIAPGAGDERQAKARAIFDAAMTPSSDRSLVADATAVTAAMNYYGRVGDFAAAESAVRRHLSTLPGDTPRENRAGVLLALSQLLYQQGQIAAARDVLEGYGDIPAVKGRQITMLAAQATGDGDDAATAAAELREVADDADTPAPALTAAALAELRLGEPTRAADLLRRADEKQPDDAATVYLLGVALGQTPEPDLDQVASLLERSARLNPANLDALRNLARVRRRQGDRDGAETALRRLLEASPGDVEGRLTLAQMQLAKSPPDYTAADRYFRAASETPAADSPTLLLARAGMEADRGRGADAATYARQAVEASAKRRDELAARTDGGSQATPVEQSEASLPTFVNGYLDLLLRLGRVDEALREADVWARRVVGDDGVEPWWLASKRAEALARAGRADRAADAYARAYGQAKTEGSPQADAILLEMGRRVGVDRAFALIRDAAEAADPASTDPAAAVAAAQLFGQAGQVDRALGFLDRARAAVEAKGEVTPTQELLLSQEAGTLHLQAEPPQLDRALAAFRRAYAVQPGSMPVNNNLSYTLTMLADEAETDESARRLLAEAVDRGRDAVAAERARATSRGAGLNPSVVDTLGWAQALLAIRSGDDDLLASSIALLREAREGAERGGDPFPEVYLHLGRALEAAGDVEAALEAADVGVEAAKRRAESSADGPMGRAWSDLNELAARLRQSLPPAETPANVEAAVP